MVPCYRDSNAVHATAHFMSVDCISAYSQLFVVTTEGQGIEGVWPVCTKNRASEDRRIKALILNFKLDRTFSSLLWYAHLVGEFDYNRDMCSFIYGKFTS